VSIAKGEVFCLPQHLRSYAAEVFGRLAAADRLRGLPRDRFIARLAEFLADVNALHPFREGNGRTQRAFFSQLSQARPRARLADHSQGQPRAGAIPRGFGGTSRHSEAPYGQVKRPPGHPEACSGRQWISLTRKRPQVESQNRPLDSSPRPRL
jgi:Fic/DOC family